MSTNFTLSSDESRRPLVGAARRTTPSTALADALSEVGRYQFPVLLNEVTRGVLHEDGAIETPEIGAAMRALVANPNDAAALRRSSRADPRYNADAAHDLRRDDAHRRPRDATRCRSSPRRT